MAKPQLPRAEELLPYLRRIDGARWYSNRGPLVRELELRLAEHTGANGVCAATSAGSVGAVVSAGSVAVVASATAGLVATLLACGAAPETLCMLPAWTFAASAHAVVQAGLVPWLVDIDPSDGVLAPEDALRLIDAAPGRLGAVLAVAPFGLPVDTQGWETFRRRTGIPVVLDAAAGFDSVRATAIPTVVSLHATKVLGVGEGGFVAWTDPDGIRAIRQRANFGFASSREAAVPALNAKLSEYTAAVGLAALDRWPATRAAFARVARAYARALAGSDIALQPGFGERWIASTTVVRLPPDRLPAVEDGLAAAGIDSRRWWGDGLAHHRAFARYPRTALPVTSAHAASTLGLPCWPDLPDEAIARIADIVVSVCRRAVALR